MNGTSRTSVLLVAALAVGACADPPEPGAEAGVEPVATDTAATGDAGLQDLIELPADFGPEGIAIGEGDTFYVGSLTPPTSGQILSGSLRTGEYSEVVAATGTPALGLKHDSDSNLLFVAGGGSGQGFVYDASSGAEVASFEFATDGSTVNDVELTDEAAYFTNSQRAELYRVELGDDGRPGDFTTIDLPAAFGEPGSCEGVPPIGGNGAVATPDGRYLLLIHMSDGALYRMDTETQEIEEVTLSGGDLCSADGLLLDGNTLYAVQNRANQVAVVEMGSDFASGTIQRHITEPFASNPATKVPTTIADAGDAMYAVTAGFAEPSPDYVVRVEK